MNVLFHILKFFDIYRITVSHWLFALVSYDLQILLKCLGHFYLCDVIQNLSGSHQFTMQNSVPVTYLKVDALDKVQKHSRDVLRNLMEENLGKFRKSRETVLETKLLQSKILSCVVSDPTCSFIVLVSLCITCGSEHTSLCVQRVCIGLCYVSLIHLGLPSLF